MPYIVIYNGEHAGNNAVAIEPMTGAPEYAMEYAPSMLK